MYILSVMVVTSCVDVYYIGDRAAPVKLNNQEMMKFQTKCGDISISALRSSSLEPSKKMTIYLKNIIYTGAYVLDTDSFKADIANKACFISNIQFMYRKVYQSSRHTKVISQKVLNLEADDIVFVSFDVSGFDSLIREELNTSLVILPCGYIKCNNYPLIQDSIKICW